MFYGSLNKLYGNVAARSDTFPYKAEQLQINGSYIDSIHGGGIGASFALDAFGTHYKVVLSRIYGYSAGNGLWPDSKVHDYKALTNVVMVMMAIDEKRYKAEDISVGDIVMYTFKNSSPYSSLIGANGLLVAGFVESMDDSARRGLDYGSVLVCWGNGKKFYVGPSDIVKVSLPSHFSNPINTKQDEHLQKSSISDKREERSTGTGISGGGSAAAISSRSAGNPQIFTDSDPSIREGKICGTVLKF